MSLGVEKCDGIGVLDSRRNLSKGYSYQIFPRRILDESRKRSVEWVGRSTETSETASSKWTGSSGVSNLKGGGAWLEILEKLTICKYFFLDVSRAGPF